MAGEPTWFVVVFPIGPPDEEDWDDEPTTSGHTLYPSAVERMHADPDGTIRVILPAAEDVA